jgi:hypothetical protein
MVMSLWHHSDAGRLLLLEENRCAYSLVSLLRLSVPVAPPQRVAQRVLDRLVSSSPASTESASDQYRTRQDYWYVRRSGGDGS